MVDLISGVTGRKPLDYRTEDTIYVRMPHGKFAVRVVTPHLANVAIAVDGVNVVKTQVPPKLVNMLDNDGQGNPLNFLSSEQKAQKLAEAAAKQALPSAEQGSSPSAAQATPDTASSTDGLVMVSVQFAEQKQTAQSPGRKAGDTETVFFQMNPPGKHEFEMARNLLKVIPPEGVTNSGCSCCQ